MDKQLVYIVLSGIKTNLVLDNILDAGYSYSMIADSLRYCIQEELIEQRKDGLLYLTQKGENDLQNIYALRSKQKKGFIEPEYKSIIPQLKKDYIYLPIEDVNLD